MVKTAAYIIKEAVEGKQFSYRQLAKFVKIDHSFLCNIAKGKKNPPRSDRFYEALANIFKINKDDFYEYQMMKINESLNQNPELARQVYELIMSNLSGNDAGGRSQRTGLSVNEEEFQAFVDGEPLNLTYKEFQLLAYLYSHPNRVLTREVLLSQVWGFDYFGGTRTVDVHIRRLRAKMEPNYYDSIETVRNIGYKFVSK